MNNSAQTLLVPNSTTNQTTGKLVIRKVNTLQADFDAKNSEYPRAMNQDQWFNSKSVTPRNLNVVSKSSITVPARVASGNDVSTNSQKISNLFKLLSPHGSAEVDNKKVVKQLLTLLAKSSSLRTNAKP